MSIQKRISLEEMRALLPPDETYTDEFLVQLRGELYDLAELALEVYFEKKRKGIPL